jgi:hypothetical protein
VSVDHIFAADRARMFDQERPSEKVRHLQTIVKLAAKSTGGEVDAEGRAGEKGRAHRCLLTNLIPTNGLHDG